MPAELRVLIFQLDEYYLALPAGDIQEIVLMASLVHSPGQPPLLSGFLNLRGSAVPVVQLRRLFDLPSLEPDLHTPLVITRTRGRSLALLVDSVRDVIPMEPGALIPLSEKHSFNECALGEFAWEGHPVLLVSVERLLLAEENQRVRELESRVQEYLDQLALGPA